MASNTTSLCKYFNAGHCRNGDSCAFRHPAKDCRYWAKGHCKHGDMCKYRHPTRDGEDHVSFSIKRERKRLIFQVSVDVSPSMSMHGNRIKTVNRGLQTIFDDLVHDDDFFGCSVFHGSVVRLHRMMKKTGVDLARNKSTINEIHQTAGGTAIYDAAIEAGGTAIYDAAIEGIDEIDRFQSSMGRDNDVYEHLIITDGEDNSSDSSLKDAIARISQPGIPNYHLTLVAVNIAGKHRHVMEKMCRAHHAKFVHVDDLDELAHTLDCVKERMRVRIWGSQGGKRFDKTRVLHGSGSADSVAALMGRLQLTN
jgi:uncharacterized protein YegL